MPEKKPAKILRCWLAMRKIGVFLRSSDAKWPRFGLPLRFGLRCVHPRCQIASDVGRAMRTTKVPAVLGVWPTFWPHCPADEGTSLKCMPYFGDRETPMPIKVLVLGGVCFFFGEGGGEVPIFNKIAGFSGGGGLPFFLGGGGVEVPIFNKIAGFNGGEGGCLFFWERRGGGVEVPIFNRIAGFSGGGGCFFCWKGGWKCQVYFYGRGDFLRVEEGANERCAFLQ